MQVMNFSSANCKNCYKCVRTCSVKAIEVKDDQAQIVEERCVACGHCLVACPQNARNILSDIDSVKSALKSNHNVIAQIAPAFRGFFKDAPKIITALYKLGFSAIEEVSIGAEMVSIEYENIIKMSSNTEFITSCCPSVVMLIEKYYPELIPLIIPIVSPMIAHGKSIKKRYTDPYVVFIGPCISKKYEAMSEENTEIIDSVITFDELIKLLKLENIDYSSLNESEVDFSGTSRGDKYPVVGGILNAMSPTLKDRNLDSIRIHGMENCKELLEELRKGHLKNVCIELSACNESCLGGPGGSIFAESIYNRIQRLQKYLKCNEKEISCLPYSQEFSLNKSFYNKKIDFHVAEQEEIVQILNKMGKFEKEDELNCGACGYNTCYEKAIAVSQGMSQVEMCVPYMRSLAERTTNEIFTHSPNIILLLDKLLNIKELNPVGEKLLNVNKDQIRGMPISNLILDSDFELVIETKKSIIKQKIYYENYNYHAYRSIIYMEKQAALLVIYTDITAEEKRKNELSELKHNALDVTQSIIDKQMRVAQEIASLLGETTAETKVALMKLKNVLKEEHKV
jgi:iron only hydrogenase large subunit-like protein